MAPKKRRGRIIEPPIAPNLLAARNREMKHRLSTSSLVLGGAGRDTRDWTLSSTQPSHVGSGAFDSAQHGINAAMKKGLQTAQIVLGRDEKPEWGSSNTMPEPIGDIAQYRGRLSSETAKLIKTSSVKMGSSHTDSESKMSVARDELASPDHDACVEIFEGNRALHDKLREAGRNTRIVDPDVGERTRYESSNVMPDLTGRLQEAKATANRDVTDRIRKSKVVLGDDRIKTLKTTQHDSMDTITNAAARKVEPGLNARSIQDPRRSDLRLGDGEERNDSVSSEDLHVAMLCQLQ